MPRSRPAFSPSESAHKGITFESVNADTRTIETNTGKLTYGMASLVPPQQAPSLIRETGLGGRWAKVKFPTFQATSDDRIYVIGEQRRITSAKKRPLGL